MEIKKRVPLIISEGKLVLTTVVECSSLRVRRQFMEFVIDTGSAESYLGERDVVKLQVPIKDKKTSGFVKFGGSTFNKTILPKFTFYLLTDENNRRNYMEINVSLFALKTTRMHAEKIDEAHALPSILGMDFLGESKFSLHVVLTEKMAYLQYEG